MRFSLFGPLWELTRYVTLEPTSYRSTIVFHQTHLDQRKPDLAEVRDEEILLPPTPQILRNTSMQSLDSSEPIASSTSGPRTTVALFLRDLWNDRMSATTSCSEERRPCADASSPLQTLLTADLRGALGRTRRLPDTQLRHNADIRLSGITLRAKRRSRLYSLCLNFQLCSFDPFFLSLKNYANNELTIANTTG